jgi:hypothetical protein
MVHGQDLTGRSSVSRGALFLHVKVRRSLPEWDVTPAAHKIKIMRAGDEVLRSKALIDSRVLDSLPLAVWSKVLLDHHGLAGVKLAGGAAEVGGGTDAAPQQMDAATNVIITRTTRRPNGVAFALRTRRGLAHVVCYRTRTHPPAYRRS